MNRLISRLWHEDDGVLSFEWVLLLTLLVIGVIGGLVASRDAIIDELGDLAQAAQGIDQSYTLSALTLNMTINGIPFSSTAAGSSFQESATDQTVSDCGRVNTAGQPSASDSPS
jgi:Flp pilus assembly pilin Flp